MPRSYKLPYMFEQELFLIVIHVFLSDLSVFILKTDIIFSLRQRGYLQYDSSCLSRQARPHTGLTLFDLEFHRHSLMCRKKMFYWERKNTFRTVGSNFKAHIRSLLRNNIFNYRTNVAVSEHFSLQYVLVQYLNKILNLFAIFFI